MPSKAGSAGRRTDVFANQMQSMMDASVMDRTKRYYRANLLPQILKRIPRERGVLLVVGVGEPRAQELADVPIQREFLGVHVAGYGQDPHAVKRAYLRTPTGPCAVSAPVPSWVNQPANKHTYRVDYFVWMWAPEIHDW